MKTFNQFLTICEAVYDRDKKSDVDLEVGKIGKDRKKTAPAKDYKPRKDIGKQRPASTRVQQPEKARGSAALSPKEAQKKAYRERKAAQERRASKSGSQSKKDLEKTASKMLSKKTTKTVDPKYKGHKQSGYSRAERQKIIRKGERELVKTRLQNLGKEKESDLKNPISTTQKSKKK